MEQKILKVLFEDESILVIDKPYGVVVNRADTTSSLTLQEMLEQYFGYLNSGGPGGRAGIVHRLDKDTSGVMLVAKTEEAMIAMQSQFKERKVEKTYLALVHGFTKPVFQVELPLVRSKANRLRYTVDRNSGRSAQTSFRTLKRLRLGDDIGSDLKRKLSKDFWVSYDKFSLVEAYPKTGRTHQIRVHLHSIFSPIVADEIYGGRKSLRIDRFWAGRMFLHAKRIEFHHPESQKKIVFESELPESLNQILEKMVEVEV